MTNAWSDICRTFFPDFDARNPKAKRAAGECIASKFIFVFIFNLPKRRLAKIEEVETRSPQCAKPRKEPEE